MDLVRGHAAAEICLNVDALPWTKRVGHDGQFSLLKAQAPVFPALLSLEVCAFKPDGHFFPAVVLQALLKIVGDAGFRGVLAQLKEITNISIKS